MQPRYSRLLVPGLALACLGVARDARADEVGSAVYIRSDTDNTTVIAPRLRAQLGITEQTKATVSYAVDVWTSASIDIMASASKRPVTEQRDELDLSVDHELEDITLTAAYRYSVEPDYVSHGGSGGLSYDFADNNATAALGLSGSSDTVGRAGDPNFSESSGTLGGRLSFTQVLGKATISQLMYEISRVSGYQVSPYRFVAIGDGACTFETEPPIPMLDNGTGTDPGTLPAPVTPAPAPGALQLAPACVPENSPGTRLRHAIALELRHALGDHVSVGGAYRYYMDDWGLSSHTIRIEGAYLPDADTILSARYRFYTQGKVDHYRSSYAVPQPYITSDKELSPLSSHRIGLELDRVWPFETGSALTTTLSLGLIFYSYTDFLPLKSMTAYELTGGVVYAP